MIERHIGRWVQLGFRQHFRPIIPIWTARGKPILQPAHGGNPRLEPRSVAQRHHIARGIGAVPWKRCKRRCMRERNMDLPVCDLNLTSQKAFAGQAMLLLVPYLLVKQTNHSAYYQES